MIVAIVLVLSSQRLPGVQTGSPPWPSETSQLRARLGAIGLQVLTGEGQAQHTHEHLDPFVDGRPVVVPANIGINAVERFLSPFTPTMRQGSSTSSRRSSAISHPGQFFDVWGVRFDARCVGGVCDGNGQTVSVFVNGQPFLGNPRSLVLSAHEEIVVALGTAAQLPSPIRASYAVPAGL